MRWIIEPLLIAALATGTLLPGGNSAGKQLAQEPRWVIQLTVIAPDGETTSSKYMHNGEVVKFHGLDACKEGMKDQRWVLETTRTEEIISVHIPNAEFKMRCVPDGTDL